MRDEIADEVDARGLNCPLPILRIKKAIAGVQNGQVVRMIATDPGSVKDIEAFCSQTGNQLLESGQEGSAFTFLVQKS